MKYFTGKKGTDMEETRCLILPAVRDDDGMIIVKSGCPISDKRVCETGYAGDNPLVCQRCILVGEKSLGDKELVVVCEARPKGSVK